MTARSAILHIFLSTLNISAEFIEEIPAPNLATGGKQFQPWTNPGPPYTDYKPIIASRHDRPDEPELVNPRSDLRPDNPPGTLQQKLRGQRKISSGVFLPPGFGALKNVSPASPGVTRPAREVTASNTTKKSELSPVLVTVSDYSPAAALQQSDEKCQYVQMMNTSMGEDCTKGGMRCERKCQQKTEEPVCTEEHTVRQMISLLGFMVHLQDVCEDVPEEVCETVNEKSCRTVQEEVCDDADDSNTNLE